MTAASPVAVAVHGGAGRRSKLDYGPERALLSQLASKAWRRLIDGRPALEIVVEAMQALEACGLFAAGRGARPGGAGLYELDAALMDGPSRSAGAVAALRGFRSPILAARAVMEQSPHVLLVGEGAAEFAQTHGLEPIENEAAWYVGAQAASPLPAEHGTVGCVALDAEGRLAAATSTAGIRGKLRGRVGDSPLIGSGTWADRTAAISCTGLGEAFIRSSAASQVALRLRLAGEPLAAAAEAVLSEVKAAGGEGGLIAIDRRGAIATPFNAEFMAFAAAGPDGRMRAEV